MSTSISPAAIARVSFTMSAYGLALPSAESAPKRTVLPTAPTAWFSRFTAISASVAWGPMVATPPATASALLAPAKSWAIRLMVSAGMPEVSATLARSTFFTAARRAPMSPALLSCPASTITLRTARATRPSVPGALRSHSSALEVVRVLDGVVREADAAESGAIGRAERLVADGLVGDARPGPERLRPLVHELAEAARLETADEGDLAPLLALD